MQSFFRNLARAQPQRILSLTPSAPTAPSAFGANRLTSFDNGKQPSLARSFTQSVQLSREYNSRDRDETPRWRRDATPRRDSRNDSAPVPSNHLAIYASEGVEVNDEFLEHIKEVVGEWAPVQIKPLNNKVFLEFESDDIARKAKGLLFHAREEGFIKSAWYSTGPIVREFKSPLPPSAHLYVGNIPSDVTAEVFLDHVKNLDGIVDIRFITPMSGNKGFIDFTSVEKATEAKAALEQLSLPSSNPEQKIVYSYAAGPKSVTRSFAPKVPEDGDSSGARAPRPATDRLYVSPVPKDVKGTKEELEALFSKFPDFKYLFIPNVDSLETNNGWAMAYFKDVTTATEALETLRRRKSVDELVDETEWKQQLKFSFARSGREVPNKRRGPSY